jgi:hypothetical protein
MQSLPLPAAAAAASRLGLTRLSLPQAVVLLGLVLCAAVLATECWRYLFLDAYLDHIEGNVAIGGWLWAHDGTPLYETWDGIPRFSNYYGPLAYIEPVPALWLLGPGVVASKVTAIAALLATIALTAFRYRRDPAAPAIQGMFLMVAGFAALSPMSFWARADSAEALLVAAALATAASPICVGLCIGLAVNLKLHAGVYFLPIVWELWRRRGWRAVLPLAGCAAAAGLAPFLAPGFSLHDYVVPLVKVVGERPYNAAGVATALAYATVLALPLLLPLCRRGVAKADRDFAIAALVSLTLLLYPSTVPGGGPYHFLPLLPVLAEARKRLAPTGIGAEFAVFPLLFFVAVTTRLCLAQIDDRQTWHDYADEALALAREAPPGTIEIGYGDNKRSYEITQLAKAELSFHGYPRQLDAQLLMELVENGIDGSRRWVPLLEECRVGRWLMPRGETPFAVRTYLYDDNRLLFDDAFRAAFVANYHPVADAVHFTVWECSHG